jgi:hypothetical protein
MKINALLLVTLAAASSVSAQDSLVAGWDFGQFALDGAAITNPVTFDTATSIPANYSAATNLVSTQPHDITTGAPFDAGRGVVSWSLADANDGKVFGNSNGTATVNTTMVSFAGTEMGNLFADPSGQALNYFGASGSSFTITVNLAGYNRPTSASPVTFAAGASSAVTINWTLNSTPIGSTNVSIGGSYAAYVLDLPHAAYGGVANIVGTVSSNAELKIDNLQVNGSAIPEPSSYAALVGLAGLGFVAARRRSVRV